MGILFFLYLKNIVQIHKHAQQQYLPSSNYTNDHSTMVKHHLYI